MIAVMYVTIGKARHYKQGWGVMQNNRSARRPAHPTDGGDCYLFTSGRVFDNNPTMWSQARPPSFVCSEVLALSPQSCVYQKLSIIIVLKCMTQSSLLHHAFPIELLHDINFILPCVPHDLTSPPFPVFAGVVDTPHFSRDSRDQ